MSARKPGKEVTKFVDKYGDERIIHRDKGVLKLKRTSTTPVLAMTAIAGRLIGDEIRRRRIARGMTLAELCVRAGLVSATPKSRMWEIENGIRDAGLRLGTLYAIAAALDLQVSDLLPSTATVLKMSAVEEQEQSPTLVAVGARR